jgi:hypothetical protein
VLTWQHRLARIGERCQDLLGHQGWLWRVIRTSNAYVFCDPSIMLVLSPKTGREHQIKNVSRQYSYQPWRRTARLSVEKIWGR